MSIAQVISKLYLEVNKLEVLRSVIAASLRSSRCRHLNSLIFLNILMDLLLLSAKLAKIPKPVNQVTLATEPLIAKE